MSKFLKKLYAIHVSIHQNVKVKSMPKITNEFLMSQTRVLCAILEHFINVVNNFQENL